jgi:hypothetical protein
MNCSDYPDPSQKTIFFIGGIVCMIFMAYSLITLLIMTIIGGPPDYVEQCFTMLQENRLQGLLRLDILTVFIVPFYYLLFFSLFIALKKTDYGLISVATILVFAGATLFLSMPSVFSYLNLSNKYAAATSDFQKNQLLAAGESIWASDTWHGTGAIIGGILLQTGALLFSITMLKTTIFNRLTALIGIVMYGLDLLHIIIGLIVPPVGNILMFIAGPIYLLWFPLVGFRLFKLRRQNI